MSRNVRVITGSITMAYGEDHALGVFIDIDDRRAETEENDEGNVYSFDRAFGVTVNLIKLRAEFRNDDKKIIELCDIYIKKLKDDNM